MTIDDELAPRRRERVAEQALNRVAASEDKFVQRYGRAQPERPLEGLAAARDLFRAAATSGRHQADQAAADEIVIEMVRRLDVATEELQRRRLEAVALTAEQLDALDLDDRLAHENLARRVRARVVSQQRTLAERLKHAGPSPLAQFAVTLNAFRAVAAPGRCQPDQGPVDVHVVLMIREIEAATERLHDLQVAAANKQLRLAQRRREHAA